MLWSSFGILGKMCVSSQMLAIEYNHLPTRQLGTQLSELCYINYGLLRSMQSIRLWTRLLASLSLDLANEKGRGRHRNLWELPHLLPKSLKWHRTKTVPPRKPPCGSAALEQSWMWPSWGLSLPVFTVGAQGSWVWTNGTGPPPSGNCPTSSSDLLLSGKKKIHSWK